MRVKMSGGAQRADQSRPWIGTDLLDSGGWQHDDHRRIAGEDRPLHARLHSHRSGCTIVSARSPTSPYTPMTKRLVRLPPRYCRSCFGAGPTYWLSVELVDAETTRLLCRQAVEDQLVISTIPAKDAAEALLRVLLLKVPAAELAPVISAVLHQRLIRKLCDACKEAYEPSPELLKKLGIPAGKVEVLYRAREEQDGICPACQGTGYVSQTAIFELLIVDTRVRQLLTTSPKLDLLRAASFAGIVEITSWSSTACRHNRRVVSASTNSRTTNTLGRPRSSSGSSAVGV